MPLMMDMTTMRVVVAITTPKSVRKDRNLCVRNASKAIQKPSLEVTQSPTLRSALGRSL